MEVLTFLLVAIVLIMVWVLSSKVKANNKRNHLNQEEIKREINRLVRLVKHLEEELPKQKYSASSKTPENYIKESIKDASVSTEAVKEEPKDIPVPSDLEENYTESYVESILEDYEEEQELESIKENPVETIKTKVEETYVKSDIRKEVPFEKKEIQKTAKKQSFLEKNPDIEKFIGENLINKIGIVILVLGLGFLVKYAIDKNWINEIGRVAIGIASSGLLIGLAHKLRKNYKSFSSVLIGGGLALLYFTISLAFHTEGYPLYQEQTLSFIILVIITAFAVLLSISYNRIEIAVLALFGGFGSPFMVSNGSGNYLVLFSYLMVLNGGMLILSYYKKWRLVNIIAFILTMLLFAMWLVSELFQGNEDAFKGATVFASGFYMIFFLMNIIYNIRYGKRFKAGEITLLLSNTFIYFSFMMIMLSFINDGAYKGLFSVLLSVFNFGFAFWVYKRKETDKSLLFLLIGLVFTFITLAIPLQLEGNYITLFWAVESVLLLWLSQKSGFKIMQAGSVIVLFLMLISLAMDWSSSYKIDYYSFIDEQPKYLAFLFNKMTLTSLVAILSIWFNTFLLKKENDKIAWILPAQGYRALMFMTLAAISFISGFLEVQYQANRFFEIYSSKSATINSYIALFFLGLILLTRNLKNKDASTLIGFFSIAIIIYNLFSISFGHFPSIFKYVEQTESYTGLLLVFRWLTVLSTYLIAFIMFRRIQKHFGEEKKLIKFSLTLLIFSIIYLLSADLDAIAVLISQNESILLHTQKTGYAVLWGLSSFALMVIGMKQKNQMMRILSLILFGITIVKLFVYDIADIPEGGKIAAFIFLGILLLIISFMYQKIKRLVIEDEAKNENNNTTEV